MKKKDDLETLYSYINELAQDAGYLYEDGEELWYKDTKKVIDRLSNMQYLASACLRDAHVLNLIKQEQEERDNEKEKN